jgi:hypothetical protein
VHTPRRRDPSSVVVNELEPSECVPYEKWPPGDKAMRTIGAYDSHDRPRAPPIREQSISRFFSLSSELMVENRKLVYLFQTP